MYAARSEQLNSAGSIDGELWGSKHGNPIYTGIINYIGEISLNEEHPLVVRISLDKQYFAVGLSNGVVKLFNTAGDKMKLIYNLSTSDVETLACTDIQFVPYRDNMKSERKHMLLATYTSGHVRIWHYTSSNPIKTFLEEKAYRPDHPRKSIVDKNGRIEYKKEYNQVMVCSVSYDGARCVTGGEDGCIRVYSLEERREIARCTSTYSSDKMDGHVMKIMAVQYHPRATSDQLYSHVFISAAWDDSIQIWDDRHPHSLWQYYGPHVGGADGIDIDGELNHILVSSWRRDKAILEVWKFNENVVKEFAEKKEVTNDVSQNQQYAKPISKSLQDKTSPSMGYVAKWLSNDYIIFGGSNLHMLKIIDRQSFNTVGMVTELPQGVYSAAFIVPEVINEKRQIKIAFCSGTKLYLVRLDKKS